MDIRNIKQSPKLVPYENILSQMYEYNEEQLEKYKEIENLPDWPFDVNNPDQQKILKDFIGNVIEELTEGIESLNHVGKILDKEGWNLNKIIEEYGELKYQEIKNHLQNANEEQADALGFFLTLFEFSNILPEDILSYRSAKNLEGVITQGICMQMDASDLGIDYRRPCFKLMEPNEITPGFTELSLQRLFDYKSMVFEVIYHLSIARNLLKSRIWKQTPVMTKELEFQKELVKAFYLYMGFLGFAGFNPQTYYVLFFKKQQLNLWRQSTQY